MQVKYVDASQFYLISNHGVARNGIFSSKIYCDRFILRAKKHLSPLCKILGYLIHDDQFQLVIKLAPRSAFIKYYENRYPKKMDRGEIIPESTYIFSQAMANLQSGAAIHFNRSEERTGAVFARRFAKVLIKSSEELKEWLRRIQEKKKFHNYVRRWRYRRKGFRRAWFWVKEDVSRFKNWALSDDSIRRLQGHFINTGKSINSSALHALKPKPEPPT